VPLLMCPNDNAAMQTLERGGVQFDMCPSCRGVWLDRGELEKLMESAAQDARAYAPPPQQAPSWPAQQPPPQPQAWSQPRRDDRDRYRDDDDDRYRKKKRDSIFDIFD
jgi:Zn-finger nucleic acid-binding protein